MIEEFRSVKDYEGIYEVSNFGRVKSLSGEIFNGKKSTRKERMLKASVDGHGYLRLELSKNGKGSTKKVHKLVAIAFLGHTPDGMNICVDHVDNDKLNNNVSNLQLISQRENSTKDRENKTSKYKGISHEKIRNTWRGAVIFQGKVYFTKRCKTELEAYELYKILLSELGLVNYNN